MTRHFSTVLAAILVVLEGIGLLVLAGLQVPPIISGDVATMDSAIALLVLTLVFAAGVVMFGVGIFRGQTWARSGGIVTQVLIFSVGLGALTGVLYPHPVLGISLMTPAIIVFALIITSTRKAPDQSHIATEPAPDDQTPTE